MRLLLLLFFPCLLFSNDLDLGLTHSLTTEGEPDTVAGIGVNTLTGHFYDYEVDAVVEGITPIPIARGYDSERSPHKHDASLGGWLLYPQNLLTAFYRPAEEKRTQIGVYSPEGALLYFHYHKGVKSFALNRSKGWEGVTNTSCGHLSARTNLLHYTVRKDEHNYLVTTADGTRHLYHQGRKDGKADDKQRLGLFELTDTTREDGRKTHYEHGNFFRLEKIRNKNNEATYHYRKDGYDIHLSDGRTVSYHNENYLLKQVQRSHLPPIAYAHDKRGRITRKELPDGRYLAIGYYDNGKVRSQRAPHGPGGCEVFLAVFFYDDALTTVTDANGHRKCYHFQDSRPHLIQHFHHDQLLLQERFCFGVAHDPTFLFCRSQADGTGHTTLAKKWHYDDAGNVTVAKTLGAITGRKDPTITIDDKGVALEHSNIDCRTDHYTYTPDHLVHTHSDCNGLVTEYSYQRGHVTSILTKHLDTVIRTQHFEYNDDAQMTASFDESDTECQVTRMAYAPCGKPSWISHRYRHNGQELDLSSTHITYTSYGKPLEERHHDATGTHRYTLTYTYDDRGRLIADTDALGYKTTHTYDANDNEITTIRENLRLDREYDRANCLVAITRNQHSPKLASFTTL